MHTLLARFKAAYASRYGKEFDESKHPRAEDGKFGSGGGSSKSETLGKGSTVTIKSGYYKGKQAKVLSDGKGSVVKVNVLDEDGQELRGHTAELLLSEFELDSGGKKESKSEGKSKENSSSAVKSRNRAYGYHGAVGGSDEEDSPEAAKKFAEMHDKIKQLIYPKIKEDAGTDTIIRDYLDSVHGRHLAEYGKQADDNYIRKDFRQFLKSYDPSYFN